MTDAEIALHENALGPDVEFMSPATLASTGLLLVEELRATRAELAKVRAKSEERRKALEALKQEDLPRGMYGPFCPWCHKYQPWSDEDPPDHREDCALMAALRDE